MPVAFLLASTFVVLLLARLRYAGEALRHASPVPAPPWVWDGALGLLGAGAVAAGLLGRRALARPGAPRALREIGIYPLGLAMVWGVLPPYRWQWRAWHYALVAAFALLVLALFWRDREGRARWGVTRGNLGTACRGLALPTALLLAAGLALAAAGGLEVRWDRLAANLVAYPIYGFLQLLVLQVFLIRRLERLSDSRSAIVLAAAGIFALVHWPNGPLVVGCLAAGAVWARSFLRHGNLFAMALSMGLLAAILFNIVPRERLHNARCGPIYVQRRVDATARVGAAPGGPSGFRVMAARAPEPGAGTRETRGGEFATLMDR